HPDRIITQIDHAVLDPIHRAHAAGSIAASLGGAVAQACCDAIRRHLWMAREPLRNAGDLEVDDAFRSAAVIERHRAIFRFFLLFVRHADWKRRAPPPYSNNGARLRALQALVPASPT